MQILPSPNVPQGEKILILSICIVLMWTESYNVKALKVKLLFNYKKKFRHESLNIHLFFKNNFTRTQEPIFLIYYLSLSLSGILMFGIYSVSSFLLEQLI